MVRTEALIKHIVKVQLLWNPIDVIAIRSPNTILLIVMLHTRHWMILINYNRYLSSHTLSAAMQKYFLIPSKIKAEREVFY